MLSLNLFILKCNIHKEKCINSKEHLNELLQSESQSNHHPTSRNRTLPAMLGVLCIHPTNYNSFTLSKCDQYPDFMEIFFLLFSKVLVLRYGFNFTKFRLNLELTQTGVSSWLNGVRVGSGWMGRKWKDFHISTDLKYCPSGFSTDDILSWIILCSGEPSNALWDI